MILRNRPAGILHQSRAVGERPERSSIRSALTTTLEFCRRNGCDLAVSSVPPDLRDDALDFGDAHIQSLFSAGETDAESGQAWTTAAPAMSVKPEPAAASPTRLRAPAVLGVSRH